jgi:TRAP-type mannitol/chloroaromatic compound transport system permease small subunit
MTKALIGFCDAVDWLNKKLGDLANWLVLVACVISAGNALIRYLFSASSNAWLEIQWYLFAGMVMLGASYTLKMNEHVRVDALYAHYGSRARLWLDLVGGILFLLPMTVIVGWFSWPMVASSYEIHEVSSNSGGLLRWPVKILVPIGFLLLTLQGLAEIVKRGLALAGAIDFDAKYEKPLQ